MQGEMSKMVLLALNSHLILSLEAPARINDTHVGTLLFVDGKKHGPSIRKAESTTNVEGRVAAWKVLSRASSQN